MTKIKEKKMSYEEAVTELEKIVEMVETSDVTLVNMGDELKRAMELIKYCKNELKGYSFDFAKTMDENKIN